MSFLTIVAIIAVVLVVWLILSFNRLVTLRNRVEEAWSDIDVQLKRRYDLIPNLVEAVKGYIGHERGVLENVTKARTAAMNAGSVQEHQQTDNVLAGTLKTLFAVAEQYPDLKANTNFLELQRELSDTGNKIQAARRFYNSVTQDYQNGTETFPNNLIAGAFGFKGQPFFELKTVAESEPVKVQF